MCTACGRRGFVFGKLKGASSQVLDLVKNNQMLDGTVFQDSNTVFPDCVDAT
jgi:hypothetical protein